MRWGLRHTHGVQEVTRDKKDATQELPSRQDTHDALPRFQYVNTEDPSAKKVGGGFIAYACQAKSVKQVPIVYA